MKINHFMPLLSLVSMASFAAFDDEGTDYSTAGQRTHVWNEALAPIELVNSILCFARQFNAEQFAGTGPYIALADESACFNEEETGDSGQSSGTANQTILSKAVTVSERASNTSPLEVSVWLPEINQGEGDQAMKFKATIRSGVNDTDPFGDFTFNFDFFDNFTNNNQVGEGEVQTISNLDGKTGFTLYEEGARGQGETYQQYASIVMDSDRSSGIGLTGTGYSGNFGGGGRKFALAFDENRVLVQKTRGSFDDLPYKSGDFTTNTKCLSRTDFDYFANRYDLYDSTTGAKVEINSGFPIRHDSDNDGIADQYGFIGYWGVWVEGRSELANGATVIKDTDGSQEEYTVVSTPGRLIKNSVKTLSLSELTGMEFHYWDDTAYTDDSFDLWVVRYQDDAFYKIAKLKWVPNAPPLVTDLEETEAITLDLNDQDYSNDNLRMFSEQLNGEVNYLAEEDSITYYEQTFIDGSQAGDALLPNDGSIVLHCWNNCPVGTITSNDISNWSGNGSPYEAFGSDINSPYTYTFSLTGDNALTLVRADNDEPVQFGDTVTAQALQSSPHDWGVRTGPMVLWTQTVANQWDIYNPTKVTEYYVWETGLNHWNKMTTVRNSEGDIVSFDKPLQLQYVHTDANDRNGDAGDFDGQTIMLNYGGDGDLWGIPAEVHVSDTGDENSKEDGDYRYRPAFSLKDGTLMGESNQYVVKAREVEELMVELGSNQCAGLVLADPVVAVPVGTTGSADIGEMPTVTGEPSVVAGTNQ